MASAEALGSELLVLKREAKRCGQSGHGPFGPWSPSSPFPDRFPGPLPQFEAGNYEGSDPKR